MMFCSFTNMHAQLLCDPSIFNSDQCLDFVFSWCRHMRDPKGDTCGFNKQDAEGMNKGGRTLDSKRAAIRKREALSTSLSFWSKDLSANRNRRQLSLNSITLLQMSRLCLDSICMQHIQDTGQALFFKCLHQKRIARPR